MALLHPNIAKLNSKNYALWSTDLKFLLIERGLWKIVNETEKVPTSDKVDELHAYLDKCDRALSTIYLNVGDEHKRLIKSESCPIRAWNTLKNFFEPDDRVRHQLLFNDFLECKPLRNEGFGMFFSKIRDFVDQLESIKHPMDNDRVIFHVLRRLPDSFSSLIQNIMSWSKENFTLQNVEAAVLAEDARQKLRQQDRGISAVYNTEAKGRQSRSFECYVCGKSGHIAKFCRLKNKTHSQPVRKGSPWRRQQSRRTSPSTRNSLSRQNSSPSGRERPDKYCLLIQAHISETDGDAFVLDTAASHHFCKDRSSFTTFKPVNNEDVSVAISDVTFPIEGKGDVHLKFGCKEVVLKDCYYSPKLRRNLIAGNLIDRAGLSFVGENGEIKVMSYSDKVFSAKLKGGIYYTYPTIIGQPGNDIKSKQPISNQANFEISVTEKDDLNLWHRRFAHISSGILHKTSVNDSVRGLPKVPSNVNFECEPCKLAKTKRVNFKLSGSIRSKRPLELLYLDLCGPIDPAGRDGHVYFFSIVDDYSRKASVFPIFHKSDAFEVFKRFQTRSERFLGTKILNVRSDNGGEFCNRQFEEQFNDLGIKFELTNSYTPEQNGSVERLNFTIMDGVKAMLEESGMSREFWPEAVLTFTYVWNRTCHTGQTKTPIELFSGNKPSVKHLKPFGTVAYVGVPKQKRVKLDNRAKKGFMVGYALRTRGYRVWIPEEDRIVESINVTFNEKKVFKDTISVNHSSQELEVPDSHSGAVMGPESEWVIDTGLNYSDCSSATPSPDPSTVKDQVHQNIPKWRRKAVPRAEGTRHDIYYYEGDSKERMRSLKNVEDYCNKYNLPFESELFDFSTKNTFSGEINTDLNEETSDGGSANLTVFPQ